MLFFYPDSIEIISRHINFDLSGGIIRRVILEKISFQNKSKGQIKEIAVEIEHFRSNLKITDEEGSKIIYLTNEILKTKKELPVDIRDCISNKDKDQRKNILWLILNRSIDPKAYGSVFLNYVEYARRTDDSAKIEKNEMGYLNHKMYNEVVYYDAVDFYSKETLSIFSHWEDSLTLKNIPNFYYIEFKKNFYYFKPFEQVDMDIRNNGISFSISNSKRIEKNITGIRLIYLFMPEKEQLRLIQVLTLFTLLIPFTEFISIFLNNISYLFDSLEVETVLILTLAFAETRTRLILHKKFIIIALIITGVLFILNLIIVLRLFEFILELL